MTRKRVQAAGPVWNEGGAEAHTQHSWGPRAGAGTLGLGACLLLNSWYLSVPRARARKGL